MKILDILRLLSGNPAKSRLLWWFFSWLSSRVFCKPGLWIWENALWPFLWPQSNPRRRVISLSLPKGKNQGPGKLPRISQTQMLACGRLLCSGLMPSPSVRCALAVLRRACRQAQLPALWTSWSSPGRRKAHFREPHTVRDVRFQYKLLVHSNPFIRGPADIHRKKVICFHSHPNISKLQAIVFFWFQHSCLWFKKYPQDSWDLIFLEAG